MKKMNFSIGVYALKEVEITIYNEELFKLKSKEFLEKENRNIELDDLEETHFEDCVSIEQGFFDWEDEDIEKPDKFYELMDDYLNEINTNY
jgi:hypothetical protein